VLTVPGSQAALEQQLLAFDVTATDADGQRVQLCFSPLLGATVVDRRRQQRRLLWPPAPDQSWATTVTFRADDTFGGIDQKTWRRGG
jgi:hypothetical protein